MNSAEFCENGKNLLDFLANYRESLSSRPVTPSVVPGYLSKLLPASAPEKAEPWSNIMADLEPQILSGMTHWQHPNFHAYFPSGASYPSVLADLVSSTLGCIGFSWAASPACAELEGLMLSWMAQAMDLPTQFWQNGCIQGSASECVLMAMLAARQQHIQELKKNYPQLSDVECLGKLVAYCSREAHSCVEKAAMIGFIRLRILETDADFQLRGDTVKKAMEEDKAQGYHPFFVSTTVGTTASCSSDKLQEIGPICQEFGVWMHVDAAYAGGSQLCPEFRHLFHGVEYAMSVNTNANKWLLTNFDCALFWIKDKLLLTEAFNVNPVYLRHGNNDGVNDYRHWGVPLSRRFRALKLWFVMRAFGLEGLRSYIRNHVKLAKDFEKLVKSDARFEVVNKVELGLLCFRWKGSNLKNRRLLQMINASGKIHMVPALLKDKFVIRFCVCGENAKEEDINFAWKVITEMAQEIEDGKGIKEWTEGYVHERIELFGKALCYNL